MRPSCLRLSWLLRAPFQQDLGYTLLPLCVNRGTQDTNTTRFPELHRSKITVLCVAGSYSGSPVICFPQMPSSAVCPPDARKSVSEHKGVPGSLSLRPTGSNSLLPLHDNDLAGVYDQVLACSETLSCRDPGVARNEMKRSRVLLTQEPGYRVQVRICLALNLGAIHFGAAATLGGLLPDASNHLANDSCIAAIAQLDLICLHEPFNFSRNG